MPTGAGFPTGTPLGASGVPSGPTRVRTEVVTDRQTKSFNGQESSVAYGPGGNRKPGMPGLVVLALDTVPVGYGFKVERIDLSSDSTSGPAFNLYIDSIDPAHEVDFSLNGNHDLGDFNNPIYVPSGSSLLMVWTGLSAEANVYARAQWAVVQFVAVTYQ